jgi:peptidoglycan/xylan/chitin deacetylase (PgdA/CDA1 family)
MKRALIAAVLIIAALCGTFALSKSTTFQLFGTIVPRVETSRKVVALTFDDGPDPAALEPILQALDGAKATFFLIGVQMQEHPEVAPRLMAAGEEIGNHTMHHDRMVFKSPSYVRSEIEGTDAVIRAAGWRGPILFRAPFGKKLVYVPWYLSRTGRTHVTWDVAPEGDRKIEGHTDRIVADVLTHVRPGSIVLLHPWYANRGATRAAIRPIVDGLRELLRTR